MPHGFTVGIAGLARAQVITGPVRNVHYPERVWFPALVTAEARPANHVPRQHQRTLFNH
jgi:hypothetical protein